MHIAQAHDPYSEKNLGNHNPVATGVSQKTREHGGEVLPELRLERTKFGVPGMIGTTGIAEVFACQTVPVMPGERSEGG